MDWDPVIQQVSQCGTARRRAQCLRSHVFGEVEDEDGDRASGFILADPIPGQSMQPRTSSKPLDRNHRPEEDNPDDTFTCQMCTIRFPLQDLAIPVLSCACLFCQSCLGTYALSTFKVSQEANGSYGEASSSTTTDSIPCPSPFCDGRLPLTDIQLVAPEDFSQWEAAASEALIQNSSAFVKCPGCHVVIEKVESVLPVGLAFSGVPEFDRTVPFIEFDDRGKPMSKGAMLDKALNRFRCAVCTINFCGACLQAPYHLGKTCEEFAEEKLAPRCIYCDEACRKPVTEEAGSVRDMRKQFKQEDVDISWCVEKSDLVAVQKFCERVCDKMDCRKRLKDACTRNMDCGHRCFGVRGEPRCPPCMEEDCQRGVSDGSMPSGDEYCGICWTEALRSAPCALLRCGHVFHLHCVKAQVEKGYPGPEITFGHLKCPLCQVLLHHTSLEQCLRTDLALMKEINEKAMKRMKQDGVYKKLRAEGNTEEMIASHGLRQYQFYMCSKCKAPYFGGKRECGVNIEQRERRQVDSNKLVCGGCSSIGYRGTCTQGHGNEFIDFKCRYCCSLATFFCYGHTHFCDRCHSALPGSPIGPARNCNGDPRRCPLKVAHPPNGQEYCLGCSLCRSQDQI